MFLIICAISSETSREHFKQGKKLSAWNTCTISPSPARHWPATQRPQHQEAQTLVFICKHMRHSQHKKQSFQECCNFLRMIAIRKIWALIFPSSFTPAAAIQQDCQLMLNLTITQMMIVFINHSLWTPLSTTITISHCFGVQILRVETSH